LWRSLAAKFFVRPKRVRSSGDKAIEEAGQYVTLNRLTDPNEMESSLGFDAGGWLSRKNASAGFEGG
jgi:hypothetical protein